ncbi:MAG: hypothetical protein NTW96_25295 [Planctomycetia bacterium]|nr:hypothetical protein [Planctomycetia bacterium]
MLHDSLDALVNMDVALAKSVCARDDEIDRMKHETREGIEEMIRRDPERVRPLLRLSAVSRNLERIADCATNIVRRYTNSRDREERNELHPYPVSDSSGRAPASSTNRRSRQGRLLPISGHQPVECPSWCSTLTRRRRTDQTPRNEPTSWTAES